MAIRMIDGLPVRGIVVAPGVTISSDYTEEMLKKLDPEKFIEALSEKTRIKPMIIFCHGATLETAQDALLGLNEVDDGDQVLSTTVELMQKPLVYMGDDINQTGFNAKRDQIEKAVEIARARDVERLVKEIRKLRESILFSGTDRTVVVLRAKKKLRELVRLEDITDHEDLVEQAYAVVLPKDMNEQQISSLPEEQVIKGQQKAMKHRLGDKKGPVELGTVAPIGLCDVVTEPIQGQVKVTPWAIGKMAEAMKDGGKFVVLAPVNLDDDLKFS